MAGQAAIAGAANVRARAAAAIAVLMFLLSFGWLPVISTAMDGDRKQSIQSKHHLPDKFRDRNDSEKPTEKREGTPFIRISESRVNHPRNQTDDGEPMNVMQNALLRPRKYA
jgi:hypothetical protein